MSHQTRCKIDILNTATDSDNILPFTAYQTDARCNIFSIDSKIINITWALICYLHNPKKFFLEIPQGPLGISIGNIRSAQKAFRVPQSSVFCHFPCFVEISPKNGICSQNRIFWPIFKCHTILESYRQHGCRATLQVKIRDLNQEL